MLTAFRQIANFSGQWQHLPSVPAKSEAIVVHSQASPPPRSPLRRASPSTIVFLTKRLRSYATLAALMAALSTVRLSSDAAAESARVLPSLDTPSVITYGAFISEAAHRFAIPEPLICTVITAESGGNAHAVSPRGALGLMQIMPGTWVELSVRYELGIDPFDPHDNIMAGTAYLREMLDGFGSDGFLAAYNAGPKRYEEHLSTGRPLPDETQAYVARLAPLMAIEQRERGATVAKHIVNWQQAPVFVPPSDGSSPNGQFASVVRFVSSSNGTRNAGSFDLVPRATGLFVQRSSQAHSQ